MDIKKIDPNFAEKHIQTDKEIEFYSATDSVLGLCGIYHDGNSFTRMPTEVARSVSEGVTALHRNTSGGRLRFKTDSKTITIAAVTDSVYQMSHFTHVGSSGFDMYLDGKPLGCFFAAWKKEGDHYYLLATKQLAHAGEVVIYFPLYCNVVDLKIGFEQGAKVLPTETEFALEKPVVFYGSSITQGGCASRAGMSYQGILCRELNLDFINLGFSGNAHGQREMAEYIASLDMSMFVFDYDHNSPSSEHLLKTHKPFFDIVRAAHPGLPIVMMSRPKRTLTKEEERRIEIIKKTYNAAKEAGDENVYLVLSDALAAISGDEGMVDNCHPTDLGFFSMAMALVPVVRAALKISE